MIDSIYIILGSIAALIVGWFTAKRQGKKEEQADQIKRNNETRKLADETRKEIDSLSDDDILERSKRWVRNNKR